MKLKKIHSAIFIALFLAGCAGLPVEEGYLSTDDTHQAQLPEPERRGVYHKVKKSETLWRIAKAYDVPLDDIIRSNSIPNVAQLEENQLVFIPGAYAPREIALEVEERENDFAWPVAGDVISYFHTDRNGLLNKGIDIRAPQGATVKAARSGNVVFADDLSGYGRTVVIKHSGGFHSVYALNADLLVKNGDYVPKNTPIARVGRDGDSSRLHFQIRKDAIESNPLHYLP
jgi:murein DD-endopeptidase MepM/ murein hydrolase activator NlpD